MQLKLNNSICNIKNLHHFGKIRWQFIPLLYLKNISFKFPFIGITFLRDGFQNHWHNPSGGESFIDQPYIESSLFRRRRPLADAPPGEQTLQPF